MAGGSLGSALPTSRAIRRHGHVIIVAAVAMCPGSYESSYNQAEAAASGGPPRHILRRRSNQRIPGDRNEAIFRAILLHMADRRERVVKAHHQRLFG